MEHTGAASVENAEAAPVFLSWTEKYPIMEEEKGKAGIYVEKSYVFSVSLGTGCYRHIRIAQKATLFQLHQAILNAFGFDDDHAHAFFMSNHAWDPLTAYVHPTMEPGDRSTKKFKLSQFKFQKGDLFKYIFDFGDCWTFQCKFLRPLDEQTDIPGVIRSKGEAPPQYAACEDDAWDEDGEDEPVELADFPEIYEQERLLKMYRALRIPQETQDLLYIYCLAAVRLYGVIPLKRLYEIYTAQNKPLSKADFLAFCEVLRHEKNYFAILGRECFEPGAPASDPMERELIAEYLYAISLEDYFDLCEEQRGKPWCILPREEFLRYADDAYYPDSPQRTAMLQFLRTIEKYMPNCTAEEALLEVQDQIEMGISLGNIVDDLNRLCAYKLKERALRDFLPLYVELHNNSRLTENRGYTPVELRAQAEPPMRPPFAPPTDIGGWNPPFQPAKPPEPSKNGPCPCGSGKKYKRCCGKNK